MREYYGDPPDESPCDVCGGWASTTCICPECPVCGMCGDPKCYAEHGLVLTVEQYKQWSPVYGPEADLAEQYGNRADQLRTELATAREDNERLRALLPQAFLTGIAYVGVTGNPPPSEYFADWLAEHAT